MSVRLGLFRDPVAVTLRGLKFLVRCGETIHRLPNSTVLGLGGLDDVE